jgi:hypothetical protein
MALPQVVLATRGSRGLAQLSNLTLQRLGVRGYASGNYLQRRRLQPSTRFDVIFQGFQFLAAGASAVVEVKDDQQFKQILKEMAGNSASHMQGCVPAHNRCSCLHWTYPLLHWFLSVWLQTATRLASWTSQLSGVGLVSCAHSNAYVKHIDCLVAG